MLKIEVKSPLVTVKSGVSAKSGKPYSIREQEAYAHVFGKDGKLQAYPVRMQVMLEQEDPPYAPGIYQLDPSCIYVDRFGGLAIARPRLIPLAASVTPARQAA
jgi:hypothetical protein